MSASAMSPDSVAANRHVGAVRATLLCYRVLIRQIVSVGRLAALGALGAIMIVVGWVVGVAGADRDFGSSAMLRDGAGYADAFGLIVIVPIISLVFAAASLGDARDDGTLVYLWLRPMGRAPVAVAAAAVSMTVALPLCVAPTVLGGWLASGRVAGSGDLAVGHLDCGGTGNSGVFVPVRAPRTAVPQSGPLGYRVCAAVGRIGGGVLATSPLGSRCADTPARCLPISPTSIWGSTPIASPPPSSCWPACRWSASGSPRCDSGISTWTKNPSSPMSGQPDTMCGCA